MVLLTGFTANIPIAVFADSRLLKQDTNQNASCDTVGADSPVSGSCNQRAVNNVNNGVPRTTGNPGTTGTILINKICLPSGSGPCMLQSFGVSITGNNPQPSHFTFSNGGSQSVTIGPGFFTILESAFRFIVTFSGDCMKVGVTLATGTISAGQHLTCTITNTVM